MMSDEFIRLGAMINEQDLSSEMSKRERGFYYQRKAVSFHFSFFLIFRKILQGQSNCCTSCCHCRIGHFSTRYSYKYRTESNSRFAIIISFLRNYKLRIISKQNIETSWKCIDSYAIKFHIRSLSK